MIMPVVIPEQSPYTVLQVSQGGWVNFQNHQGFLSQPIIANKSKLIVYFATGKSELSNDSKHQIARFMTRSSGCLSIVGSSSSSGNAQYNLKLSQQRANHVAVWIKQQKKDYPICCIKGKGEIPYSHGQQAQNVKISFSGDCQ